MSPEQIEGRETDARSDIFALGAVLYEMVTGRRAFEGKSEISVASAILEKEPQPITAIQRTAPAALDRVIRTCLAKDREQRYQSAFDVKLELRWIAEAGEDINRRAATTKRWREWLAWGLVAAFLAAAIVATYSKTPAPPAPRLMATVVPPAGVFPNTLGRNGPPQLSPDGSRVAFIGCKTESESQSFAGGSGLCSIWLRSLGSIDAHEVAGTNGGYFPFWSPDGRDLAFFADGKLKRVPAGGGPVQVICDAQDARGGSWGISGEIIFSATRGSPIFRVAAAGGIPEPVTRSAPPSNLSDVGSHRWPKFLPDGEHFLYVNSPNGACSDQNELHFASLDGKQDVSVMRTCSSADFAAGHLIYWRDSNLVAQRFDASRGVLTGSSNVLAEHVAFDSLFSFGEFSVSGDDKLVYITGEGVMGAQLAWHDRTGKVLGTIGEDDQYTSVAISPSGSSVVADTSRMQKNIRVINARGSRTLVTSNSIGGGFPTWSADGRQIYFTSRTNGPYNIRMKAADGSGDEQPLVTFEKGFGAAFLAASTDGKYLAYVGSDPITKLDIYTVPLSGERKPLPFLHSSANESAPVFSPDGKWLAYESDQSARNEVYITRFPGAGAQYQVSTMGGERPIWRRDGKEIFYREGLRLMAVEVTTNGSAIQLGTPQALFELAVRNLNGRWYDVSPDGRFLTNTAARRTHAQNFELVVNWPAQLKD
jgi:Tol biopolymer transport system component